MYPSSEKKVKEEDRENSLILKRRPPTLDVYKVLRDRITITEKIKTRSNRVFWLSKMKPSEYKQDIGRIPARPDSEKEWLLATKEKEGVEDEAEDDVDWEPFFGSLIDLKDEKKEVVKKKVTVGVKKAVAVKKMNLSNPQEAARAAKIIQKYIKRWLAKKELRFLEKKAIKRQNVAEELLKTEADYINHLKVSEEVWVKPLKAITQRRNTPVSGSDYNSIFGTGYTSLKNVNQTFYDSLDRAMYKKGVYQRNADISKQIMAIAPFFKMYRTYCVNYKNAMKVWGRLKKIPSIRPELLKMEKDNRTTKLGLISYLILPIQRIPRYRLLIRDLIKATLPEHPDRLKLNDAIEKVKDVADFLDESIYDMTVADELKGIQEKFIIPNNVQFEIVSPHRKKIREGSLQRGLRKLLDVYVHLFNDHIVLSNKTGKGQFMYQKHVDLSTVRLFESKDMKTKFKVETPSYSVVLSCPSEKLKVEWMNEITKAVESMKQKRQFSDVKQSDLSSTALGVAMETNIKLSDQDCVEFVKLNKTKMIKVDSGNISQKSLKNLTVTKNEKKIEWDGMKGKKEGSIQLKTVQQLVTGQKTNMFRKNPRKDLLGLSFSLLYGSGTMKQSGWTGKTLDLICETKEEFIIWTKALGFILKDQGRTTTVRNRKFNPKKDQRKYQFSKVGNDCYSWGKAEAGGLGHHDSKDQKVPKVLKDFLFLDVDQFECGESAAFLTINDGKIFAWGSGKFGKLGLGNEGNYHTPTQVKALGTQVITQVSCGESHTLVLSELGRIWAMGKNDNGQTGIGKPVPKVLYPTKIKFPGNVKIKLIAAGTNHSGAITEDGLYTWGAGKEGQLGHGDLKNYSAPKLVRMFKQKNLVQIALGFCHSLALTKDGNIWVFGDGTDGQLGNGKCGKGIHAPKPEQLQSAFLRNKVKQIACGAFHCAAVTFRGKIYMWGNSMYGQVGNGKKENAVKYPTLLTQWIKYPCHSVVCGTFHSLAMLEERQKDNTIKYIVIAWGAGTYGRLGVNKEVDSLEPKEIKFFENKEVKSISAGGCMSACICAHQWVPDKDVKKCMTCNKQYTFKRRKHHCRMCGGVYCSDCTKYKQALIGQGFIDPVKVCNNCNEIVTAKRAVH